MFKICMKNYFANLKYVFVALGVMFIALIIGAQAMVNKSVKEINIMIESIEETTESSDLSFEDVGKSISGTFKNISPKVITGKEEPVKVEKSIGAAISEVVQNYIVYFGDILEFFVKAIAGIIVAIIIFLLIQILGVFTSSTLITIFGRFDIANDNVLKIIAEQLVRIVFVIVWIWIIVGAYLINSTAGIVVAAAFPLVYCYFALLGVWVTAGKDKRPKYSEYASFGNILVLLGCNLLQIIISVAFAAIAYFLGGIIVAAVFGIALMILAVANVNLNAYAFLYKKKEIEKAIEEKTDIVFTDRAQVEAAATPLIPSESVQKEAETEGVKAGNEQAGEIKAEEPKVEEAKAEDVKAEDAKAEEVKAEEAKAEAAKSEDVKAEEAKPEEVKAEAAKPAEPMPEGAAPQIILDPKPENMEN